MKNKITKKITITGALGALTIFLGITKLGLIPFPFASITIMHVPVIIGALLEGPIVGAGIGLIFGVFSLIQAAIAPTGALDPFFVNPVISVLPRICIGLTTYFVFFGLSKIKILPKVISFAVASFVGSLTNTVLVLGSLTFFPDAQITREMVLAVTFSNGLIEAAAAVIISTAVAFAWFKLSDRKTSKLLQDDETEE